MEYYIENLKRLSAEYLSLKQQFIPYDQYHLEVENRKIMDALLEELKKTLECLSLNNCGSDSNRFLLQTALDECNRNTGGCLSNYINKVQGKIVTDGRAKFQGFCMQHKVESEKINDYARCVDFRRPFACNQVSTQDTMYQWCMFNSNGEMLVGQWFTKEEVEPYKLGLSWSCDIYSKGIKILKWELFKKYQGVGKRVLCSFSPFLERDCFISTANGAYDSWSSKDLGQPGHWNDGGAIQYFVPLSDEDKKYLGTIVEPIRQWDGN